MNHSYFYFIVLLYLIVFDNTLIANKGIAGPNSTCLSLNQIGMAGESGEHTYTLFYHYHFSGEALNYTVVTTVLLNYALIALLVLQIC